MTRILNGPCDDAADGTVGLCESGVVSDVPTLFVVADGGSTGAAILYICFRMSFGLCFVVVSYR